MPNFKGVKKFKVESYYDILGVSQSADKAEIKKAYFKQVKIKSPEKDPSGFKILRKAYEELMDDSSRKKYDKLFETPAEYIGEMHEAKKLLDNHDYPKAINFLKKLDEKYKDEYIIQRHLAMAYSLKGNTNTAIKILKSLVEKNPADQEISLMLAAVYHQRGYDQKAEEEHKRAVQINPQSPLGWVAYIEFIMRGSYGAIFKAAEVAKDALDISEDMFKDACRCYLLAAQYYNRQGKIGREKKYLKKCVQFLLESPKMNKEDFRQIIKNAKVLIQDYELAKIFEPAIPRLEEFALLHSEYAEEVQLIKRTIAYREEIESADINNMLKDLLLLNIYDFFDDDPFESLGRRRRQTELELEILKNAEQLRPAVSYLKKEYPKLYNIADKFFDQVLDRNSTKKILKQRETKNKKHNQEEDFLQSLGLLGDLFEDLEPFVREQPKIGRNEPCPCGSGKKYKQCCGR